MARSLFLLAVFVFVLTSSALGFDQGAAELIGRPCRKYPGRAELDTPRGQLSDSQKAGLASSAAAGDLEKAIELTKVWIGLNCYEWSRWLRLASLYVELGYDREAVQVLEFLYDRDLELVERNLTAVGDGNPIGQLATSEAYLTSDLRLRFAFRELTADERRALARRKLAELDPDLLPPDPFIQNPSCPGEHCGFGNWRVYENTEIYDEPWSTHVVGMAEKGTEALALEGEYHVRNPDAVFVVDSLLGNGTGDERDVWVREGDILFLLDYWSEGWAGAWHDGRYIGVPLMNDVHETCSPAGNDCWGEYIEAEEDRGESEWWFKLRLADGTEGWSREDLHFLTMSDKMRLCIEKPEACS